MHCMGLKEATIGQYYGLLEWRVLMHPQYYLYNTEQSSAVRITMCTRPYVSLAINGSTPPPYSSYRWFSVPNHYEGHKPEHRNRTTTDSESVAGEVNDSSPRDGTGHTHKPKKLRHLSPPVSEWGMMATYSEIKISMAP